VSPGGDSMSMIDKQTRICIWIILIGLGNFLVYTVLYMFIGPGEAANGHINIYNNGQAVYVLHTGEMVSRAVYIYSGIHSISIWPTVGAVMLAMLTLAKERISSSMRRTIIRGRTLITILATIITLIMVVFTLWFTLQFIRSFRHPRMIDTPPPAPQVGP
jgi:hypothetical protein